jgi:hypothetical protein
MKKHEKNNSELVLYRTEDGKTRMEVRLQDETVWLTQKMMSDLFQITVPTINEHIKNIFAEGELSSGTTIRKFLIVQSEGSRKVSRSVDFYNLEMIVAVGFRVRSARGTQFRKWAIDRLNEYMVKGFTMDDDRLKTGANIGSDYFDDMLERIRDIRSSEKRFYQKIRDIYKLAVDYDPKAEETQEFFSIVQNKLHFAVSGKTAAELIHERADAKKPNMGLTSWKGAKVRRRDVTIAKNYLNRKEIEGLNRIVTMYLDYAEYQAKRHKQIFVRDWREKLDAFLRFNEHDILGNSGKVMKNVADKLALGHYETFNRGRLAQEAAKEALTDDAELRELQGKIEKKKRKKTR